MQNKLIIRSDGDQAAADELIHVRGQPRNDKIGQIAIDWLLSHLHVVVVLSTGTAVSHTAGWFNFKKRVCMFPWTLITGGDGLVMVSLTYAQLP